MAGVDLGVVDNVLKTVYLGPVTRQLNDESLLLQKLPATQDGIVGKEVQLPLSFGRSGGIGARDEWDRLPEPGNQAYGKVRYDLKYLYGAFGISGPADFKTKDDTGSFIRALKEEIDGLRVDLQRDLTRQLYGSGDSKIATAGVTTASTTVVLASAEMIVKGQLYPGMVVDIGTLADPKAVAAAVTIIDVNPATPSILISGANVTTSGVHFIFRSGNAAAVSKSNEITGLQQIVADNAGVSVGNLSPTTAAFWENLRMSMGGTVDRDKILQMWNQILIAGGTPSDALIITSFGVQRGYFNSFSTNVHFNDPLHLKGGFVAVDFNGTPLVADRDAPWGKMYFLNTRWLKIFSSSDFKYLDKDGHTIRWIPGYDAWSGVLYRYMNLGTNRRNTQGVITGVTDTTGY